MAKTVWFENSHNEKLHRLRAICSSQPSIRLHPVFKPLTWASDPFIVFQNGIRSQLIDLLAMLLEMATRIDTIKPAHCTALRNWITEIGRMVALYFHIQEHVILPELNALQPGSCSVRALRGVTYPLVKMLINIHASALKLETASRRDDESFACQGDDTYESFRHLSELIFAFAIDCEKRFSQEGTAFESILIKGNEKRARGLLRQCVQEFLSLEEGERTFRGYSASLPSDIRDYCLTGFDGFKLRKIKSWERKWCRNQKLRWQQVMGNNHRPPHRAFQSVLNVKRRSLISIGGRAGR